MTTEKEHIVILGAGESGTGAALLANAQGLSVFVSDMGTIAAPYKAELEAHGVAWEEGGHTEAEMLKATEIIKSPGIPDAAPVVKAAMERGIPVINELEFAWRYTTAKIIAITGTNGKSTTSKLTWHLLKTAGYNVGLGGNIGKSLARLVAKDAYEWFVVEVSSFQLDNMHKFKADIAVLLNITEDHLDRYNYEMARYAAAKMKIAQNQTASDHFIYFEDDGQIKAQLALHPPVAQVYPVSLQSRQKQGAYQSGQELVLSNAGRVGYHTIHHNRVSIKGPHNRINAMAASLAALLAGVEVSKIEQGLGSFESIPHRMEEVGTIEGARFINDSKATNVEAVRYALESYTEDIIWIAGGIDKGNDYDQLQSLVMGKVKALICLGKDNEKLKNAFARDVQQLQETEDVYEAVMMAHTLSEPGDVVLLSPACSSFDLFKNYEHRGDRFREEVLRLKAQVEKRK